MKSITYWMRSLGIIVVFLSVIAFIYIYQQVEHNRDIAECHTSSMDELHERLGQDLYDNPNDPVTGISGWSEHFKAWEKAVSQCDSH